MLEKIPPVIGRALAGLRSGKKNITCFSEPFASIPTVIQFLSPAFADGEAIPRAYTADGVGLSPPLQWRGVPDRARNLVILVEDADAPTPKPLVHAIAELPLELEGALPEGALSRPGKPQTLLGKNSFLQRGYLAPDPPRGHGAHRYVFQIYALTQHRFSSEAPGRSEILRNLREHAIGKGSFEGTYERR